VLVPSGMKRVTGSVVVCAAAGLFTAGALFYQPTDSDASGSAAPVAASGPYATAAGASGAATGATGALRISGFEYSPVTVTPGARVAVSNADTVTHTVTADGDAFDVTVRAKGSAVLTAPSKPGTYRFTCAIHPEMHGVLVVR
jgi:plastocyanin